MLENINKSKNLAWIGFIILSIFALGWSFKTIDKSISPKEFFEHQKQNKAIFQTHERELVKFVFANDKDAESIILGNTYIGDDNFSVFIGVSSKSKEEIVALAKDVKLSDNGDIKFYRVTGSAENGLLSGVHLIPLDKYMEMNEEMKETRKQDATWQGNIIQWTIDGISYVLPAYEKLFNGLRGLVKAYDNMSVTLMPDVVYGRDLERIEIFNLIERDKNSTK